MTSGKRLVWRDRIAEPERTKTCWLNSSEVTFSEATDELRPITICEDKIAPGLSARQYAFWSLHSSWMAFQTYSGSQ